jgi:myosin heavy subunit
VEVTALRQITHLQLKLAGASDAYLREHLQGIYKQQREEIDALRAAMHHQPISLQCPTSQHLQHVMQPPQSIQSGGAASLGSTQPIGNGLLSTNFVERCRQLEERLLLLDTSNAALKRENTTLETKTNDLEAKYNQLVEETSQLRADLKKSQELLTSRGLTAQIAGLEQAIHEKDTAIGKLNDLLQAVADAKAQAEAGNAALRDALAGGDRDGQLLREEVGKANEIIRRLQDEARTAKSTLKTQSSMLSQQEKLLHDLRHQYDTLRHELTESRDIVERRARELGSKDGQLQEASRQARLHRVTIEGLQAVVARQNRVLEEHGLDFMAFETRRPISASLTAIRRPVETTSTEAGASTATEGEGLTQVLERYDVAPRRESNGDTMLSAELSDLLKNVNLQSDSEGDKAHDSNNNPFLERIAPAQRLPRILDDLKRPEGGEGSQGLEKRGDNAAPFPPPKSSSSSSSPPSLTA